MFFFQPKGSETSTDTMFIIICLVCYAIKFTEIVIVFFDLASYLYKNQTKDSEI